MKKPSRFERFLLRRLVRAENGLTAATLCRQFGLTPIDIAKGLRRLEDEKIVEITGPKIALTNEGRKLAIGAWLVTSDDNRPWRQVPEEFVADSILIGRPIVPRITEVHPSLLPAKYRRVRLKLLSGSRFNTESNESD